jgi:CRISPR-associated protein Cmr5
MKPSRDQQRAQLAFEHVQEIAALRKEEKAKYASMVHKLPALLTSSGLCQALYFLESRPDDKRQHQRKLVNHLALQLARIDREITSADALLKRVRDATLPMYLRLTDEAIACAAWYRRMVQAVLKLEASDADPQG